MRKAALLLVAMAAAMLVGTGVALAATIVGTSGPDARVGTNAAADVSGLGGNDVLTGATRGGREVSRLRVVRRTVRGRYPA